MEKQDFDIKNVSTKEWEDMINVYRVCSDKKIFKNDDFLHLLQMHLEISKLKSFYEKQKK